MKNAAFYLLALMAFLLAGGTAFAQIAQRGSATTAITTSNSLTINKPTGVVQGDVMIVNIAQTGNNFFAPSASGWTLIDGADLGGSTPRYGAVLYRVAGASEGSSYTFSLPFGVSDASGAIVAFSGVDTNVIFDVTPGPILATGNTSTAVGATGITTASANAAVIMFGEAANVSSETWSTWKTTSPGNLTQLYSAASANDSVGAAWATKATAGATGSGSATLGVAARSGGVLIALRYVSASHSTISPATATKTADGTSTQVITVQARDINNNNLTNSGDTVVFSATAGTMGATTYIGNGTYTATWTAPTSVGSGTATITATLDGTAVGTAVGVSNCVITLLPGAATKLVFTTSSVTVTAGMASSTITVQRQDLHGNPATNGTITVNLTTSSATGSFLSADGVTTITSTNILANSSIASFLYTDTVVGSPTITNTATGLTSATQTETVIPAAASKLLFTTSAVTVTAGVASGTITVERLDQFGNLSTNGSTTVNLTTSSAGGNFLSVNGVTTITSSNILANSSIASFLYKDTVAGTPTITNSAAGLTSVTQQEKVNTAGTSKLVFTTSAVTVTAGVASGTITVQRQDQFGNPTTNGLTTVNLTTSSAAGSFLGVNGVTTITSTNILANTSTASFLYKDTTAGTPTITSAATGLTNAMQQETVIPAAASTLVFTTPAVAVSVGVASGTITVQRLDQFGNLSTNGVTTVNLTTSSSGGSFLNANGVTTITSTNILANSSSASFLYKDTTAGTPTITNSATGLTSPTQQEVVSTAIVLYTFGPDTTHSTTFAAITNGVAADAFNSAGISAGVTTGSGNPAPSYGGTGWQGSGTKYFYFTITNLPGTNVSLSSLKLDTEVTIVDEALPPASFDVYYAVGAGTPILVTNGISTGTTSWSPASSIILNGISALQNISTNITFRLVGQKASGANDGWWVDNVRLNGASANPTVTAWPTASAITYGQTLASSTLSGGSASVPGTFAFTSPFTVPGAGTAGQSVTFTPADAVNYNTVSDSVSVTVNKAMPTVMLPTASAITYGQTLASSSLTGGTATNALNGAQVAGAFAFTIPSTAPGAGTASQSVTFTPTDTTDYNTASISVSVTVNKANPNVTTWPTASAITYGQTLASSTLSGGVATPAGTFAFTTPSTAPGAGTASQPVTFIPTDTTDYNTASSSVSVTVNKANPNVTTWPTASAITYGQTLASSTLSGGVATPAGTFAFTTPSTAPGAGTAGQSVTFTPTDTTDYNTASSSVNVTVNKANPNVTTWPTASAITYGQTLASSTLSGGVATPAGIFAFTAPSAAPGAGTASQLVTFTPTDTTDYNTASSSVSVTVNKATPTATLAVNNSPVTFDGTTKSATVGITASSVPGTVANILTGGAATQTGAGSYAVTADFVPTDTVDYNTLSGLSAGNFVIQKATPTATLAVNNSPVTYDGTAKSATVGITASSAPGTLANILTGGAATQTGAGTYAVTADFVPADSTDYSTLSGLSAGNFVIQKATPVIIWNNPADITNGTALDTNQLNATVMTGNLAAEAANPSDQNLLYDDLEGTSDYAVNFDTGPAEIGNNLTLLTSNMVPTFFDLQYYFNAPNGTTGNEMMRVRFYLNDGPAVSGAASPGTLVYDSGDFSMATYAPPTARAILQFGLGQGNGNTLDLSTLLTDFTWTVQVTGLDATEGAGLTIYDPATVPGNHPTYWQNTGAGWTLEQVTGFPSNFGSQLYGVLNPTPIAGTLVYNPTNGTVLNAGANQTLSVAFTPDDTNDYNGATDAVSINVLQGSAVIAVPPIASPITYGQTLASSILTGGAVTDLVNHVSVAGSFAFTTPSTAPGAGTVSQSVTFTPTDTTDYIPLTVNVNVTVNKATPTAALAVNNSPVTYDGTAQAATVGITVSSVPGTVANILTGGAATQTNAGTYVVSADFAPMDSADYNTLSGLSVGNFVIQKATPTATLAVNNSPAAYNGTAQAATVGITVSSVPGTVANILTGGAVTQTGVGTYAVTADFVPNDTTDYNTLSGLPAGNFVIRDTTPVFTGLSSVTNSYGVVSIILTGQFSASGPVYPANGDAVSATINGFTVSGTVTNSTGGFLIDYNDPSLATNGVSGSPYPITYNYGGNAGTSLSAGIDSSTSLTIVPATPVLTLTASVITYGQTLAASSLSGSVATNAGNNAQVTGSFAFQDNTIAPNAGNTNVLVIFTPDDAVDYDGVTNAVDVTVNKATPTAALAVNNTPVTYDGAAQAATVGITASSVPGTVANILTGGAVTQTGAGTYAVTADFVPNDTADYNTLSGLSAGSFVIQKATPTATLAVNNSPVTYDGTAKAATVGITVSSVPGTVANILTGGAATQTGAGTYAVTADFVPNDTADYNTLSGLSAGSFVIQKATPTATLAVNNSPVTYDGTAKAATVGITVSSVPGTVANILTGGAATQTGAGSYAVAADFVPNDTADYNTLSGLSAGNFVIQKATPTATLAVNNTPVAYDGTAKAATVGITASSVPGTVANILTGGAATQTSVGTYAVTADFVPTDTADYNTLSGLPAGNFVIQNAASGFAGLSSVTNNYGVTSIILTGQISALGPVYPVSGDAVSATINGFTVSGTVTNSTGGFLIDYNDPSLATNGVSGSPYPITYNYGGNPGVSLSAVIDSSTSLTIVPATPVLTLTASAITYGQTLAASSLSGSVATNADSNAQVTGSFAFQDNTIAPNAGVTNVLVIFTPDDAVDYDSVTNTVEVTVNKATPTATLAVNNSPVTYDGTAQAATVGITVSSVPGTVVNILTGGAATQTGAGIYAVTADFVPNDTADYNTLSGLSAGSFVIQKATPTATLTVNNSPVTYDGTAKAATVGITASSVPGTVANILTGGVASQTGAGIYAVTADFVPNDSANYNTLSGLSAGNFEIQKATSVLALTASAITYGQTFADSSLSGSVATNAGNNAQVTGSFAFQDNPIAPNAGSTNVLVIFTPDDVADYNDVTNAVSVTVNPKALSITAPTIASKPYDGTAAAGAVTVGTISGEIGSETVTATATAAAYSSTNVGTYANDVVIYLLHDGSNGGLAANYSLAPGTATGQITPATVTITGGISADSRGYDGTINATLTIGAITFTGVIPQDAGNVSINTSGAGAYFANNGPGNNIPVTVTNLTLAGSAAGNYQLTPLSLTANIIQLVTSAFTITDAGAGNATAGVGDQLTVTAVQTNGAVNIQANGNITVTFSGLSAAPDGSVPTVTDVNGTPRTFGTPLVLSFVNGVASTANTAGVLVAYDAQTAAPHITDGTHTDASQGGSTVSITVSAGPDSAYRIGAATTSPQTGAGDALTVTLVDRYQNQSSSTGNKTITFGGLSAGPDGSLPTVNGTSFGTGTTISFSSGSASATLVAHKVESNKLLTATDGLLTAASTGGVAPTFSPIVGAAARLGIITQPSTSGVAGVALATQPVIGVLDQYGNPVASSTVSITVTAAVGNVLGTYPTNAVSGVATFSGLSLTSAGANGLTFTSAGLISTNSTAITIGSGPYTALAWTTQPGAAVYGSLFGTQPVLATVDHYGNPSTNGLPPNLLVTVTKTSGPGTLSGTTGYNMGSSGSNGVVDLTDLAVTDATGTNYQLTASIPGGYGSPVSGMAVWLDASDTNSVVGSSAVTQWNDKSGNNYNFGVPAGSGTITYANTMNGLKVVTFPAGPALLTTNNAYSFTGSNMTLFCVVRHSAAAFGGFEGPFSSTAGAFKNDWNQDGSWSIDAAAGPYHARFQRLASAVESDTELVVGKPFIWEGADMGTGNQMLAGYDDGSVSNIVTGVPATTDAFAITQLSVGARLAGTNQIMNPWNGDIAEVLLYHSYLSASQQAQVYSYLNNKWLSTASFNPPASATTVMFTVAPAPLAITSGITADNKFYDGTTTATLSIGTVGLSGVFPRDSAIIGLNVGGVTATFASAGLGNNIPVTTSGITLTGSDATNYVLMPLPLSANITPAPSPTPMQISAPGGTVKLNFNGLAGSEYIVQRTTNLSTGAGWVNISTNTTSTNATFTITDTFLDIGAKPGAAYYRLMMP